MIKQILGRLRCTSAPILPAKYNQCGVQCYARQDKCNFSTRAEESLQKKDDAQFDDIHIDEAVKLVPKLGCIPKENWLQAYETFRNHGLTTSSFLRIVTGNPGVMFRPPHKFVTSLEIWRSCQFGEYFLHLLLTKYPTLIDIKDGRKLLKHIGFLRTHFHTPKNVWKVLMNCPTILEQSHESIDSKMKYFQDVMHLEYTEIMKSAALAKPLNEIKCRHVLQERLGIFIPRPLKMDPHLPTKNVRLYKITDTSDKTFATKVCHISIEEFEAFKQLYAMELEQQERKLDSNDSLSDDDDDDYDDDDIIYDDEYM